MPGEEDVEHDRVVGALAAPPQAVVAVVGDVDVEPLGRETVRDRRPRAAPRPRPPARACVNCAGWRASARSDPSGASQPLRAPSPSRRLGGYPGTSEQTTATLAGQSSSLVVRPLSRVRCAPSIDPAAAPDPGCGSDTSQPDNDESEHFPMSSDLRRARPPGRPRRCPRTRGHHRALPHPVAHHPRRPRRPRHLRQGQDRLGQDPRLRPADARPRRQGRADAGPAASCSSRPASSPTRSPRRCEPLGKVRDRRVRAVYGGVGDGPAGRGAPQGRRRRRRHARPPHRPHRARRAVGRRRRGARRRRGRPHGRHGLHAPGAEDPLPHRAPSTRRCCSPPRSTARSSASSTATCTTRCTTRSTRTSPPSTRWSTASCSSTRWTR